jgi:hypothetical protein
MCKSSGENRGVTPPRSRVGDKIPSTGDRSAWACSKTSLSFFFARTCESRIAETRYIVAEVVEDDFV